MSRPTSNVPERADVAAAVAPRRWSVGRKLALQCALLPVLLVVLELGYRGWQSFAGHAYDASGTLDEIRKIAGTMSEGLARAGAEHPKADAEPNVARPFLHPYFGFGVEYFQPSFANDARYFRGKASRLNYDVLIVGGSVAGRFCEDALTAFIEGLQADPRLEGRKITMHTYPTGGFKQPQQLDLVAYMFSLGIEPDAVINIDGFNELAEANYNARHGSYPLYPSLPHWLHLVGEGALDRGTLDLLVQLRTAQRSADALAAQTERFGLQRSAILGHFTLARLHDARRRYTQAYQAYVERAAAAENPALSGPPFDTGLESVLDLAVRNWKESSLSLAAMCCQRGIYYVHVLQPTLHDAGSKPLTPSEIATSTAQDGWVEAAREGYPRLREAGEELRYEGVCFVDCSRIFADVHEDLYFDACHFNAAGNAIFEQRIRAAFLESLP